MESVLSAFRGKSCLVGTRSEGVAGARGVSVGSHAEARMRIVCKTRVPSL
jgi:hypothetical protein